MDPYTLSKSRWRSFRKTSGRYNSNDCPCCWGYHKRKRVAFKRDFADELENEYRVGRLRYSTTSAYVFLRFLWDDPYKWGYPEEEDSVSSSDATTDTEYGAAVGSETPDNNLQEDQFPFNEDGWEMVSNGTGTEEQIEDWENIDSWELY